MTVRIFEHILLEKIQEFRSSFLSTSKSVFVDEARGVLFHPQEFGTYREAVVKSFIRLFVPERLEISTGFLINDANEVSTQCDLVIYDRNSTPLIQSSERQRFFPVETVCGVGEVKSVLSKAQLIEALPKLSKIKAMREKIKSPVVIKKDNKGAYNPIVDHYDQIPTFLICQKLDFNLNEIFAAINEAYRGVPDHRNRHNLILSLEDGLFCYYDRNNVPYMYPCQLGAPIKNRWIAPKNNPNLHFKMFTSYLFLMTTSCTILYPEVTNYMGTIDGGEVYSEK